MVKEWIKISDLLFFQEGPGVRNTQYTQSGVKLLNVANLVNGKVDLSTSDRYISEDEAYGRYKHFLCDDGDFIIASSGIKVEYFDRKMGFVDSSMLPLCMNTSTIRFKVIDSKRLNIKYFMYYLKSIHFKQQLSKFITGSAQLNFGPSHLKKMNMPLVSLKEQNVIVEKLSKVELLLDKYNGEIKLLDELIKARFVEMFGDPITNDMLWNTVKLNDVCYGIGDGLHGTPEYDEYGDYPFINGNNLKNGMIEITPSTKMVNEDIYRKYFIKLTENTILLSINGTLGNLALYNGEKVVLGKSACYCNLIPDIIRIFVCSVMKTDAFSNFLESNATSSTIKNIGLKVIREFELIVPPLELQNQFASFVQEIDKSRLRELLAIKRIKLLLNDFGLLFY